MGTGNGSLPRASMQDTLSVIARVLTPTISKGVIIRRPRVLAMAERFDLDRAAIRAMQRIRDKNGDGPLMLRIPGRRQAILLAPDHVRQVLDASPEPFATASLEKAAALSHFEPKGALVSHGPERAVRRRFNEEVLDNNHPMHRLAEDFVAIVDREARVLLDECSGDGRLNWERFSGAWFRIVRQVIFGSSARDDEELRQMVDKLRSHGNWGPLHPGSDKLRERFFERMREYLDRAGPGSLAAVIARRNPSTAPEHQIPQWLFAFDPAGMTTFRSLGLLAEHPEHAERAQTEARDRDKASDPLPFLRATVLESLRLWPTTPLVLRETTRDVEWESGIMPANTSVIIYAPFFHRDDQRLSYADRFAPELWLDDPQAEGPKDWPLIPFSGGPGICPGRHVVLLVTSAMLAAILTGRPVRMSSAQSLSPRRPLPGTLNNYSMEFDLN